MVSQYFSCAAISDFYREKKEDEVVLGVVFDMNGRSKNPHSV